MIISEWSLMDSHEKDSCRTLASKRLCEVVHKADYYMYVAMYIRTFNNCDNVVILLQLLLTKQYCNSHQSFRKASSPYCF